MTQWERAAAPAARFANVELLRSELGEQASTDLVIAHRANPAIAGTSSPKPRDGLRPSCDRRLLRAAQRLEQPRAAGWKRAAG